MSDDIKLPLTTPNPADDVVAHLREAAPQVFSEGKIDFDKLKAALGEHIDTRIERYGLTWAGKSEAFRAVQAPSVGTLLPMPEESVNFDSNDNLIIEGDNLEVLKLLQKGYHGKVKMIYIDPPYNTGNEFIYPDNYREGLDEYLRYSGQVSEEGVKQTTNTETSGRFHSRWLNMMYPRLFLARNVLRDDGVIFVSIDDNEVHNLRMLMNEVFGEENFVANVIWEKKFSPQNDDKYLTAVHDHILLYARNKDCWRPNLLPRSTETNERFKNPDNDPRGPWSSGDMTSKTKALGHSYPVESPSGKVFYPPSGRQWAPAIETYQRMLSEKRIWFGESGANFPRVKQYLSEVQQGMVPMTIWKHSDVGHNQEAKQQLNALLDREVDFDTPKPSRLIQRMLELSTRPNEKDIVVDFFAGSGSSAQAVLDMNRMDGGNRKFILVQLPEKTDNPQYPTIAHITRERVRRVITKLNAEDGGNLVFEDEAHQNRGFRSFRLSSSNFKIWDAENASTDSEMLAKQLQLYADNIAGNRTQPDVLFELILKSGLPLGARVEVKAVAGRTVHSVADGTLLICLENPVTPELLRGMMVLEPQQILCLDAAFQGDDPLKTNTVLEAKSHGITFRTV